MADRTIHARKVQIGGIKIPRGLVEYNATKYNPIYGEIEGSFMAEKIIVGYEPAEMTLTIKGVGAKIAKEAIKSGRDSIIIYSENGVEGGSRYDVEHTTTGLVKAEFDGSKMKEQQTLTLTQSIRKHRHVDDGSTVTDVDIENGKYLIDGFEYNK